MASRSRKLFVRFGGMRAGTQNGVDLYEPAYVGQRFCSDETHPGPPYLTGGPLLVNKKKVLLGRTASWFSHYDLTPQQQWAGHMVALPYVPSPEPTPMSLSGWGAKGWNRTFPLHPIYNLGVSLLEVKDLPRMISQTRLFFNRIRSISLSRTPSTIGDFFRVTKGQTKLVGSDYLNVQFGWVPFIQDLAFIISMQEKLSKKLRWLKRHNGKSVRRKIELDSSSFSENINRNLTVPGSMRPVLATQLYSGSVISSQPFPVLKSYRSRIWYSAKYKFFIPELAKPRNALTSLKLSLLGIDLDPSIIYKVIPWTWLLDWFTNVGAILQNIYLRSKYHVVSVYAYVMGSEDYSYDATGYSDVNVGTKTLAQPVWTGGVKRVRSTSRVTYEFRQREVANPYGFGITYSSLSSYQWSILVALGISRRGKSFAPRT